MQRLLTEVRRRVYEAVKSPRVRYYVIELSTKLHGEMKDLGVNDFESFFPKQCTNCQENFLLDYGTARIVVQSPEGDWSLEIQVVDAVTAMKEAVDDGIT